MQSSVHPNLCSAADSVLLLVDMQPRISAAMDQAAVQQVVSNSERLLIIAAQLEIPVLVTEQYPEGLGRSFPALLDKLPNPDQVWPKTGFSCTASGDFVSQLEQAQRAQVILLGQETHVCVLQTAFALLHAGYQVYVVEDAVCSRSVEHKHNALQRLRQQGITITSHECVLFEWLQDARHPLFKTVSKMLR